MNQKIKTKDEIKTSYGNWHLAITRNMSFWHQWMSCLGHFHNTKDFGINSRIPQLSITHDGMQTSVFYCSENLAEYSGAILEAISTIKGIKQLKAKYQVFARKLLLSTNKLYSNLNCKNWDSFVAQYTRLCAGLFLTSTIGRAGMTKLMELLEAKHIVDDEISEVIGIITYPNERTPLFQSRLDLLKVAAKIQKGIPAKERTSLLNKWLRKYGFIPVNYCEDAWILRDAEKQLNESLGRDCQSELKRFDQEHENKKRQKREKLKSIGSTEISVLAQGIAEGTYLNEFRKNVFSRVSLQCQTIFLKIAKLGGSDNWRDCFYLTPDEIRLLIDGAKLKIKDIVEKRKVVGIYADKTGKNQFIEKDDLRKFVSHLELAHGQTAASVMVKETIIKGFTANRGIIKGIVRVVFLAKDFHKVNSGDILVTAMTSVDFIPVMDKAAAFITNEGGITSHAAIVAREMNKPCIIGTKIATQVLKDGDLVEVDADKGIVKILKKK